MIPIISLPARIIRLLESNVSAGEIAAGVCLGMFLGFTPLNGPMVILLVLFFLFFKLNRLSVILALPVFKLLYVFGVSYLADSVGGFLLIDAQCLTGFWRLVTHLPVITYLGLNNTLVTGGLAISAVFCAPVYLIAKKCAVFVRNKYAKKIQNLKFVKWIKKIPIVHKITTITGRLRGSGK